MTANQNSLKTHFAIQSMPKRIQRKKFGVMPYQNPRSQLFWSMAKIIKEIATTKGSQRDKNSHRFCSDG
jgi:hypothetical protein